MSGKDRDALQEIIALLRRQDLGIDMQFTNYRSELTLSAYRTIERWQATAKRGLSTAARRPARDRARIGRDAVSGVSAITEIAEYLRDGGGKRIRPALLLLAAKLLGYTGRGAIRLGAVVEMVHTATLVHDDIIDGPTRAAAGPPPTPPGATRSACSPATGSTCRPSRSRWRSATSACSTCSSSLTQQMVEGELLQIEKLGRSHLATNTTT